MFGSQKAKIKSVLKENSIKTNRNAENEDIMYILEKKQQFYNIKVGFAGV